MSLTMDKHSSLRWLDLGSKTYLQDKIIIASDWLLRIITITQVVLSKPTNQIENQKCFN